MIVLLSSMPFAVAGRPVSPRLHDGDRGGRCRRRRLTERPGPGAGAAHGDRASCPSSSWMWTARWSSNPQRAIPTWNTFKRRGLPMVAIGKPVQRVRRVVPYVDIHSAQTTTAAARSLHGAGRQQDRHDPRFGAAQFLRRVRGDVPGDGSIAHGQPCARCRWPTKAVAKMADTRPRSALHDASHPEIDAFCVPVDAFAVGAVRACTESGRRVPQDVKVATRYDGMRARTCRATADGGRPASRPDCTPSHRFAIRSLAWRHEPPHAPWAGRSSGSQGVVQAPLTLIHAQPGERLSFGDLHEDFVGLDHAELLRAFSSTMSRPSCRSRTSEASRSLACCACALASFCSSSLSLHLRHVAHAAAAEPQLRSGRPAAAATRRTGTMRLSAWRARLSAGCRTPRGPGSWRCRPGLPRCAAAGCTWPCGRSATASRS